MIRIEKILCPVDFFPASLRAFEYACRLAVNYDARVHVVHVIAPIIPAAYGSPISIADVTNEMDAQAKKQLQKLREKAQKKNVLVDTEVRMGDIDLEIRRVIKQKKADLVVMGTHGRRGFERWVMGSVTERLLRSCPVPLMTIRSTSKATLALRRILVATDFSEATEDALAYAFSLAQEYQAKITLLHVIEDIAATEVRSDRLNKLLASVRRKLEELVPDEARVWCDVRTRVEIGAPYMEIQRILKTERADLLVMNVHGAKPLIHRALVGSTAERVVRGAECPVMLIPPKALAKKSAPGKRQPSTSNRKVA